MAKKSASSAKLVKKPAQAEPTTAEKYEEKIAYTELVLEQAIVVTSRIDYWSGMRDDYIAFFGADQKCDPEEITRLCDYHRGILEDILTIVRGLTFEDFDVDPNDFVDPLKPLIKHQHDCEGKGLMAYFEASSAFLLIRPYAEMLINLNKMVWSEHVED